MVEYYRLEANLKAEVEYDKFRVIQDRKYESDFDKEIKKDVTRVKWLQSVFPYF